MEGMDATMAGYESVPDYVSEIPFWVWKSENEIPDRVWDWDRRKYTRLAAARMMARAVIRDQIILEGSPRLRALNPPVLLAEACIDRWNRRTL